MKMLSTTALGLALALGAVTTASPALAAKEKAPKEQPMQLSAKVREAAVAAQKAIAADDVAGAKAAIAAAEPEAKTPDDKMVIGQLTLQVAQKSNDQALLVRGADIMIDSGKASASLLPQLLMVRAKAAYQAKDYAKAEQSLLAAQQAGSNDPDLVPVLVSSMHEQGKDEQALQLLTQGIDKMQAANQPVPESWYQRGIALGYGAKGPAKAALAPATAEIARKWVAAYPTKSNWRDSLIVYRDSNKLDPDTELDLYRLLYTTGAMKGERDYMDYVLATYLK